MREPRNVFIPNGDSRQDTAILLVGTADEHGIDQHDIASAPGGFFVTERLADLVYEDQPADDGALDAPEPSGTDNETDPVVIEFISDEFKVSEAQDFVTEHPMSAEVVLAAEQSENGQHRPTLVKWLTDFIADRDTETE